MTRRWTSEVGGIPESAVSQKPRRKTAKEWGQIDHLQAKTMSMLNITFGMKTCELSFQDYLTD